MGYPNDWYLFDLSMEQLPYHENYMDQCVKTKQSDEFHYNLIEPKS